MTSWLNRDFHQIVHLLPSQTVGEAELLIIAASLSCHLPHHLNWVLDDGGLCQAGAATQDGAVKQAVAPLK